MSSFGGVYIPTNLPQNISETTTFFLHVKKKTSKSNVFTEQREIVEKQANQKAEIENTRSVLKWLKHHVGLLRKVFQMQWARMWACIVVLTDSFYVGKFVFSSCLITFQNHINVIIILLRIKYTNEAKQTKNKIHKKQNKQKTRKQTNKNKNREQTIELYGP